MRVVRGEGADVEKLTVGADWVISHDTERGVVQEFIDGTVRQETMVRAGLIDQLTREAVVFELTKLGYTVIPPEETQL